MHIIQIVRNYLGFTQAQLSAATGISQADISEMETKPPFGRADKHQRLSEYLGISVHALVTNDCSLIPLSFFEKYPHAPYSEASYGGNMGIGRGGEEAALEMERQRLTEVNPSLAKLMLPLYKMRIRPGYDILSFHEDGRPLYIEVKTTTDEKPELVLTRQEYDKANKAVETGETYLIYRYSGWGTAAQKLRVYDIVPPYLPEQHGGKSNRNLRNHPGPGGPGDEYERPGGASWNCDPHAVALRNRGGGMSSADLAENGGYHGVTIDGMMKWHRICKNGGDTNENFL